MKKTYLELNTEHLQRPTITQLGEAAESGSTTHLGWPELTVAYYGYGVFVSVPDFQHVTAEQISALPADLASTLLHAASLECELIRFDVDGYVDVDLPYFQEL